MNNELKKGQSNSLKEKTQYGLTFGIIAMMLVVANFPFIVIFFFGVFAYFLWKTFSSPTKDNIRDIFEFYISAKAVLCNKERKWFGFELREVIARGEKVLRAMNEAPPLLHFALGALYNKIGDHESAVNHLSYVFESGTANESTYIHPSIELRNYVKVLRKIESEPTEAPKTSEAISFLEHVRKNRGLKILKNSRKKLGKETLEEGQRKSFRRAQGRDELEKAIGTDSLLKNVHDANVSTHDDVQLATSKAKSERQDVRQKKRVESLDDETFSPRKPITEVLHDIYDKNIQ